MPGHDILQSNPAVTDPNVIHPGQALSIPLSKPGAAIPDTHVVAPGETLSGIASHYRTSTYRLATANGIADPNRLQAGQSLFVPGQPPAPAPPASATPAPAPAAPPPSPADQAHSIVAAAQTVTDPVKSLQSLNGGYAAAPAEVRTAVLADPGAQGILRGAAAWANQPLASTDGATAPEAKTAQAMQRLDQVTQGIDKDLGGAVAEQTVAGYEAFQKVPENDVGQLLGMQGVTSLMNVAGRVQGSAAGDRAATGFARLGAWNGDAVVNSIAQGADPAYPIALAKVIQDGGQSPSIVVGAINDGIAQRDLPRIGAGGSPQPTLDVAARMQAAGLDAGAVAGVARQGVDQFRKQTTDDVTALAKHDAELGWLVQNDGAGLTPQQLNQAVASYRQDKGAAWNQEEAALRQKVTADGSTLVTQMLALNQAAPTLTGAAAATDQTIRTIANDPAAGVAISAAVQNDPNLAKVGVAGNVADLFGLAKVGDIGRKFTNELASNYVRDHVQSHLQGLDLTNPASVKEAEAAIGSLEQSEFAKLLGVSPSESQKAVAALRGAVAEVEADPSQADKALARLDDRFEHDASLLKAFNKTTPAGQILRGVGLGFAGASLLNSANKAMTKPDVQNDLKLLVDSAGFAQKNAELLVGLGRVSKEGLIGQLGGEWKPIAQATAGDLLGGISAVLDTVTAVRAGFGLGMPQDTGTAVFSGVTAVGGGLSVAPAFGASAWLGPVGIGVTALGVIGNIAYQDYKEAHQFEGASAKFLRAAGYTPAAADALAKQGGLISGASGAAQMPFLAKYAQYKHLDPEQMQRWVNGLTSQQLDDLSGCLLQTAGDSDGDVAKFTDGPPQSALIASAGVVVPLANTVSALDSNLAASGVPHP